MSFLKEIEDKGAVLDWCPVSTYPNLVALGTKVFFDFVFNHIILYLFCYFPIVFCNRILLVVDSMTLVALWNCTNWSWRIPPIILPNL